MCNFFEGSEVSILNKVNENALKKCLFMHFFVPIADSAIVTHSHLRSMIHLPAQLLDTYPGLLTVCLPQVCPKNHVKNDFVAAF